jgi:hypothetical protein
MRRSLSPLLWAPLLRPRTLLLLLLALLLGAGLLPGSLAADDID